MKIGASTYYGIIKQSVVESVNELERAGFDTLEFVYEYNNLFTDREIEILKTKKLDFSMHCPFIGVYFTHLNPEFSAPQIKLIENSLDAAIKIGCSHYVMHGGSMPVSYSMIENPKNRDFFMDLFIKRFADLFQRYTKMGLKIIIENLPRENQIGSKTEDIIKIQEAIPEIGFCYDIAHGTVTNQTNEILRKLRIDYVHATDNNLKKDEHKVIGTGKINFIASCNDL